MSCSHKRIVLYALYDDDGIIDDYIVYCLRELQKVSDKIVLLCNCKLTLESVKKISFVDCFFEREDKGYDLGAIADGLNIFIGWNEVYKYDELVVMNDSTIGPIYPFTEVFDAMDSKDELDFWGLTERGKSNFDGGEQIYPEHIQLYFYVIRKKMLHSIKFKEYFENITNKITDFRSAIINYEFMFTKHFSDLGYNWGVYCCDKNYITDDPVCNLSPYHYDSNALVRSYRCPLIKRKLFTGDFVRRSYSDRYDLSEVFNFIKNNTEYDTRYIWQHILRKYNLRDIIASMNLYKIINNISTDSSDVSYNILKINDNSGICSELIHTSSDASNDYVLVINDFQKLNSPYSLVESRKRNIIQNMAENMSFVSKIFDIFNTDRQLGVLIPPAEAFGKSFFSAFDKWLDKTMAYEYYRELGLTIPLDLEKAPVHSIYAFWCRKNILTEKTIELLKKGNDTIMRMVPLVAQQMGYYTSVVINSKYVPNLLKNMYSETEDIINTFYDKVENDNDFEKTILNVYDEKISDFCKGKSKIYIYGAGQLAQKIVKLTEKKRKIDGIYVTDTNGNSEKICGYKVNAVSHLQITDDDYGIIVAVGSKNNKKVKDFLNSKKISNILILS